MYVLFCETKDYFNKLKFCKNRGHKNASRFVHVYSYASYYTTDGKKLLNCTLKKGHPYYMTTFSLQNDNI